MFSRASWIHLRIPFSYLLLPVFLFSLSVSPNFNGHRLFWVFFIVHFLLYPASNAYNSYFDKDEKSIGLLKTPPPVSKGLYWLSLLFDTTALVLGLLMINLPFAIMLLVYGLISKGYSHPVIRLKKYAISSWLVVGIFQGLFTFAMFYVGVNAYGWENIWTASVIIPGSLCSALLLGTYPMTQIYQHEEDGKRGDHTFSRLLGIRGTFYFVAAIFMLVTAGFCWYFSTRFSAFHAIMFVAAMGPVVLYFLYWFTRVWKDESKADFRHTMILNFISATCLNGFFAWLFLSTTHVLQTF